MQKLIERLRSFAEYEADLADESKWERIEWEAAYLIESQAAEIGVLKIAHEAHQTNNLKMLAVLKKQAASIEHYKSGLTSAIQDIEKYKALCDQMVTVMTNAVEHRWPYLDNMRPLIEAWRAMK